MATVPASASPPQFKVHSGVPPLKPGEGHSFFWRRLHSITGIVPIGAFLIEHILVSNATAINGPAAYNNQVKFLGSLPLVIALEAIFIWLPILFHGLYGLWIWYHAAPNVTRYPWEGNWMFSLQRWTGVIAFAYMGWHVWHLRFSGIDLHAHPAASFGKVQMELANPWLLAFYIVGLLAASWHFSYGIWLFCAKWGIAVAESARRKILFVSVCLFLLISIVGLLSLRSFVSPPQQPLDAQPVEAVASRGLR
jgi:succinate dehydrogenase / fumarate reductase cytochrome b subunit